MHAPHVDVFVSQPLSSFVCSSGVGMLLSRSVCRLLIIVIVCGFTGSLLFICIVCIVCQSFFKMLPCASRIKRPVIVIIHKIQNFIQKFGHYQFLIDRPLEVCRRRPMPLARAWWPRQGRMSWDHGEAAAASLARPPLGLLGLGRLAGAAQRVT